MKYIILTSLLGSLISLSAYATSGTGGCKGVYRGKTVEIRASMRDISSVDSGEAAVYIDGRLLAHFEGRDMKMSFFSRSFSITNNHGDSASGRLTSILTKSGVLSNLSIPSYGIYYQNIPMKCWSQRSN